MVAIVTTAEVNNWVPGAPYGAVTIMVPLGMSTSQVLSHIVWCSMM